MQTRLLDDSGDLIGSCVRPEFHEQIRLGSGGEVRRGKKERSTDQKKEERAEPARSQKRDAKTRDPA